LEQEIMADNRLAVFIDGPSLFYSARALGFEVDFKQLLSYVGERGWLLRAYYYTTVFEDRDYQAARPLLDWLTYNNFTVRTKPVGEVDDGEGRRKYKRNISLDLAVDALNISRRLDKLILFSGDGDFRRLIEAVQRRGVHTTVISTVRSQPPMMADELRRQADEVLELDDLKGRIGRPART
jgi:uncharacterized LabA/DUF88 family protein